MPQSFYVHLASFSREHPEIKIELAAKPVGTSLDEWFCESIDFCAHYRVSDAELGFVRIDSSPFVCLMSSFHPLASKSIISKSDLADYSVYSYSGAKYSPAFRAWCETEPCIKLIGESFSSVDDLMHHCINNDIFAVPQENGVQRSFLVTRSLDTDIRIDIGLVYRKKSLTSAGKTFLRHLM